MTTDQQLGDILAALQALEVSPARPRWAELSARYNGRTWTLPRGVTFTTPDTNSVYVETKSGRDWDTGRTVIDYVEVTVYGEMRTPHRYDRRAQVVIRYNLYRDDTAHYTKADMPDGARTDVTIAVAGELEYTDADWHWLAAEASQSERDSDVRRYISNATRSVEEALRALARPPLEVREAADPS